MRKAPTGNIKMTVIRTVVLVKSQAVADYITEFDSVHKGESLIFD
jgi:hypothetical protein